MPLPIAPYVFHVDLDALSGLRDEEFLLQWFIPRVVFLWFSDQLLSKIGPVDDG